MHTFEVFYENADTDEPKKYIGEIRAHSASEALQKASEFWEVPSYDLVVYLKEQQ